MASSKLQRRSLQKPNDPGRYPTLDNCTLACLHAYAYACSPESRLLESQRQEAEKDEIVAEADSAQRRAREHHDKTIAELHQQVKELEQALSKATEYEAMQQQKQQQEVRASGGTLHNFLNCDFLLILSCVHLPL